MLHDVLGIRNPETGLSLLHRPGERSESGIRNLKSLVQPETNAHCGQSGIRNLEFRLVEPKTGALVGTADVLAAAQTRPVRDSAIAVARDRYHRRRPPCCTSATRAIDSSSPEAGRPRRRPRGADRKRQRPDKLAIAPEERVSGFRIPECRLPCARNFVGKSGFTSNSGAAVSRLGCACVKRPNSGSRFPEVARSKNSENADAQVLDPDLRFQRSRQGRNRNSKYKHALELPLSGGRISGRKEQLSRHIPCFQRLKFRAECRHLHDWVFRHLKLSCTMV